MPPRHRDPWFLVAVALTVFAAIAVASYADCWFHGLWLYARPLNDHGVSLIREPGWLMIVHEFGMGSIMQLNPTSAAPPPRFTFYYEPTLGSPVTVTAFQPTTIDLYLLQAHLEPNRTTPGADALIVRHELVTALALIAAALAWWLYRRSILSRRANNRLCVHCGYDLRGQPEGQTICPECGKSTLSA
ncbi:MAG: hypothetical protein AAGB29_01340 [Planctomycetota bacterium]